MDATLGEMTIETNLKQFLLVLLITSAVSRTLANQLQLVLELLS